MYTRSEPVATSCFYCPAPSSARACILLSLFLLPLSLSPSHRLSCLICRDLCELSEILTPTSHLCRKSESLAVCDVDEDLVKKLKKFRFRKETNNAAIVMKIDKDKQLVILEEEHEVLTRGTFIVYSYKYVHDDGRVSYPLCFIFSSPAGCKPEQQMMYAGSLNKLVQTVELTKVFEIRNTEDLTEEWLREKLGFFG
ncbi:hypothetical protein NQZ68_022361 [Dissostichus eleginoides]|nr:hypothetical protein NQZ68_022361 [Dissostichus eleginoides]